MSLSEAKENIYYHLILETTFAFRYLNYYKIIVFICRENKLELLTGSERSILTAGSLI